MQERRTTAEGLSHHTAVGIGEDGELYQAGRIDFARQTTHHWPDHLFDRPLPAGAKLVLKGRHLSKPLGLIAALVMDLYIG